jgi:alpha-ketoglutaric semialdehyde dehydrogenase
MTLTAEHFIAGRRAKAGTQRFNAKNPGTSSVLEPAFVDATTEEIEAAVAAAEAAVEAFQDTPAEQVAKLLQSIAEEILALGDALLERAHQETGLPLARLTGERARTVNQARLFAAVVREGSWVDARIDHAEPQREPLPKPDLRRMLLPLGPVVVFGASNFPIAISVAGSDTISALGARCPVVVKAHPAHPGTSEMVASAIVRAVEKSGLPAGIFSLLQGASHEVGHALVGHPKVEAVAFTGSLAGGRALWDLACSRPRPIPVYAEMGSTNPVFLLPGALAERAAAVAQGYVGSVTLGVGQFCTNPGLVFAVEGAELEGFRSAAREAAEAVSPGTMLHEGILGSFQRGTQQLEKLTSKLAESKAAADASKTQAACVLFTTNGDQFEAKPELSHEVFGPASVIVACRDRAQLERIADNLEGHLTATIHGTEADLLEHHALVQKLTRKVGRLIFNGFPTGIEVCAAMHHGGPYPATSDGHFTSIGTASILRFARPVCFQNFPEAALPPELKEENPRKLLRLVDNEYRR